MRDDVLKQSILPKTCAIGDEVIESGFLWPEGSDEQWFICETHLPLVQAKSIAIEFKNSLNELMEDFRKKQ